MKKILLFNLLILSILYSCKVTNTGKKKHLTVKEYFIKQVISNNKDFFKAKYFLVNYPLYNFDSIDLKNINYTVRKDMMEVLTNGRTQSDKAKNNLLYYIKVLKEKDTTYIKNQMLKNKMHFITKKLVRNKVLLTKTAYSTLIEDRSPKLEEGVNAISNPIFNKAKTKAAIEIYTKKITHFKENNDRQTVEIKRILYKLEEGKWLPVGTRFRLKDIRQLQD